MEIISRKYAAENSLDLYCNGKPCVNGEIWFRKTKNSYCQCHKCDLQRKAHRKNYNNSYILSDKQKSDAVIRNRDWRANNRDKSNSWQRQYRKENYAHITENRRRYEIETSEIRKAVAKLYRQNNPHTNRQSASKRRAKLKKCSVEWGFIDACQRTTEMYKFITALEANTGIKFQIDHMYPLQGESVSGLHVVNNLQIIPSWLNWHKNNSEILMYENEWVDYLKMINPELFSAIKEYIPEICKVNMLG